jgi:hypothetical protein
LVENIPKKKETITNKREQNENGAYANELLYLMLSASEIKVIVFSNCKIILVFFYIYSCNFPLHRSGQISKAHVPMLQANVEDFALPSS